MNEELTLHERIASALRLQSPECADRWEQLSPIRGIDNPIQAIAMANDFWRVHLGLAGGASTIPERACLVETMAPDTWWHDFSIYVAPVIVRLGLPWI